MTYCVIVQPRAERDIQGAALLARAADRQPRGLGVGRVSRPVWEQARAFALRSFSSDARSPPVKQRIYAGQPLFEAANAAAEAVGH